MSHDALSHSQSSKYMKSAINVLFQYLNDPEAGIRGEISEAEPPRLATGLKPSGH